MTQGVVLSFIDDIEYQDYTAGMVVDFPDSLIDFLKRRRLIDTTPSVVAAAIAGGKLPVTHVAGSAPAQGGSGVGAQGPAGPQGPQGPAGVQYPRQAVLPSGVAWLNTGSTARIVNVSGGTVSAVSLATAAAPTTYVPQGSTSGNFTVAAGGQIKIDWSVQPTVIIS